MDSRRARLRSNRKEIIKLYIKHFNMKVNDFLYEIIKFTLAASQQYDIKLEEENVEKYKKKPNVFKHISNIIN